MMLYSVQVHFFFNSKKSIYIPGEQTKGPDRSQYHRATVFESHVSQNKVPHPTRSATSKSDIVEGRYECTVLVALPHNYSCYAW